ncbi:hypothetical protein [Flavobacterium pectinovorum]|uniref:HEPN AbiU2-like domain-containing protein n=1 Tax=Flavobacterium pectinovorum TaxID=29533 RepID=A0A502E493_9FLAO|nr:hypothetical protein [Flavobacterium pectinovorum]TPG31311.1 hypothetical protein EAH81_26960 [Flavobacterium pectinovorum]
MQRLLESYKTLLHLGTQMVFFNEVYKTYRDNEDYLNKVKFENHYAGLPLAKVISGSLQNYSHIIACSFIDEYNKEFSIATNPEFSNRIKRLKQITKPAMKRLNSWSDFKNYRNYILAHNYRIGDKSIFASDFKPILFNIPHTNAETVLVVELIKIITTCINYEFPELLNESDLDENLLSKMKFNYPNINVEKEIEEIWNQINVIRYS